MLKLLHTLYVKVFQREVHIYNWKSQVRTHKEDRICLVLKR